VQRLEALDRLSLYFCLGPLEGATIDAVPADYMGTEVDWDLQPEGNDGATLEPYPSAATRWKSAFWRDEFRSGVMRMILSFRKCWPRRLISGRNSRYGTEAYGCGRESLASE